MRRLTFGEELQRIKDFLGCEQKALVLDAGSNKAVISRALRDVSNPSRATVNKLVLQLMHAIDTEIKEKNPGVNINGLKREYDPAQLDAVLLRLLSSAGFIPHVAEYMCVDSFWSSLRPDYTTNIDENGIPQKAINIAWFDYPPFTNPNQSIGMANLTEGLSKDVCDCITQLLGFNPNYIRIEQRELLEASLWDKAHMVAPLLMHPTRLVGMSFSTPLPELSIGLEAITYKHFESENFPGAPLKKASQPGRSIFSRLRGGVAHSLFRLEYDRLREKPVPFELFNSFSEWKGATQVSELPQYFLTDEAFAMAILERETRDKFIPSIDNALRKIRLSLALAVNPSEPKLLAAINETVKLLHDSDTFSNLYNEFQNKGEHCRKIMDRIRLRR